MAYREEYYGHGRSFEQYYCCYPFSCIGKLHLENGDKVIMPASALELLVSMGIDYPMQFEIQSPSSGRVSHCGVLEFSAEEGSVFVPNWMMKNLQVGKGEITLIKNRILPKGTFMKLQPHKKDFIDLNNPKAVLETTLRNFSCLTAGDTVVILYNGKEFAIDVVETKPSSAISIIETDCEVEFAPPLDYKEPVKPAKVSEKLALSEAQEKPGAAEEPKFRPFTGVARRVDEKPLKESALPAALPPPMEKNPVPAGAERIRGAHTKSGKLMFGSNAVRQEETLKNEEQKFIPFTGKKYTLID
ncbi:uncharacterized protein LOC131167839 [Malania oleifera]|uniref:uncharacterized protein LOC131167839 n=1 Tax=Malania oleifera TaxID=397392 RepID=UPI0025ADEF47|nr:uncharacterized protein LOC131167839 [Malania oleifera]